MNSYDTFIYSCAGFRLDVIPGENFTFELIVSCGLFKDTLENVEASLVLPFGDELMNVPDYAVATLRNRANRAGWVK